MIKYVRRNDVCFSLFLTFFVGDFFVVSQIITIFAPRNQETIVNYARTEYVHR